MTNNSIGFTFVVMLFASFSVGISGVNLFVNHNIEYGLPHFILSVFILVQSIFLMVRKTRLNVVVARHDDKPKQGACSKLVSMIRGYGADHYSHENKRQEAD